MIEEYFEMYNKESILNLIENENNFGIMNFIAPECHDICVCFTEEYMYKFLICCN